MEALNGQYQASFDGKAPKACVEQLHFGLWGEDRICVCHRAAASCVWRSHLDSIESPVGDRRKGHEMQGNLPILLLLRLHLLLLLPPVLLLL